MVTASILHVPWRSRVQICPRRIVSQPGMTDGLCWNVAGGEASPLGEFTAQAAPVVTDKVLAVASPIPAHYSPLLVGA